MKSLITRVLVLLLPGLVYVGCSDVKFRSVPQSNFIELCTLADIDPTTGNRCRLGRTLKVGAVDILFVDDNSGSMSPEQKKMGDRIKDFISVLEKDNIDYQIAITTTDISSSSNPADAYNGNGAFQDGKFLEFSSGVSILSPNVGSNIDQRTTLFANTIQRQETINCEDSIRNLEVPTKCPSGDERGIYAINKVLDRGDSTFFRSSSLFAVVILSDEDERSGGGTLKNYPLEPMDTPENLVSRLGGSLGPDKSMAVFSIIIPTTGPESDICYDEQYAQINQNVFGYKGTQYAALSEPSDELKAKGNIIPGLIGNICDDDYSAQLSGMAQKISTASFNISLPCVPEEENIGLQEGFEPLTIHVSPDPGFEIEFDVKDKTVTFTQPNQIPAGSEVEYSVVCKRI